MTGHIFLADDYYGFDDGLYAAVRLIRGLTRLGRSVTALRDEMPNMANTPELRFPVADSRKFAVVEEVRARLQALGANVRSEEHTSELQSLMRISYAVFCLKKKKKDMQQTNRDES